MEFKNKYSKAKFSKVLITGGCGFLGQYLTKGLLENFPDVKIKILDFKPNINTVYDFNNNSKVKILLNKDICDYGSIENEFKNMDVVIHLAGIVSFSIKDKNLLEEVNINGTKNVLKAAIENNIEWIIHISSTAALGYNDKKDEAIDESYQFDWTYAHKRKKYYMLSKWSADMNVRDCRNAGKDIIILYPGFMFGPGDTRNSSRLIKAIKEITIPFHLPGGTNVIDVRDVAEGVLAVLKKGITVGDYLITGHNLTYKEINEIIADELEVKSPRFVLPRLFNPVLFFLLLVIEYLFKNKLQVSADNIDSAFKFRYFSNKRAKNELGWQPKIDFKTTIHDTVKWLALYDQFKR